VQLQFRGEAVRNRRPSGRARSKPRFCFAGDHPGEFKRREAPGLPRRFGHLYAAQNGCSAFKSAFRAADPQGTRIPRQIGVTAPRIPLISGSMGFSENDRQQPDPRGVEGPDGERRNMRKLQPKPTGKQRRAPVPLIDLPMTDPRNRDRERSSLAEEPRWIDQALAGDGNAFDRIVEFHFGRVYALLFRMIGNHEDAEDLAQECFIKAQASLRHFRKQSSLSTWLFRIAIHQSRDHFRKKGRRPLTTEFDEQGAAPSPRQGPASEARQREFQRALRKAMDALTHKRRVALVLRTQESMEYDEIAQVLECNAQTARVHVMKARKQLRDWLNAWQGEEGER
jgi:RNA polymerase sigma-70 factor, ECF subfamily